jgi:hypothetical protein
VRQHEISPITFNQGVMGSNPIVLTVKINMLDEESNGKSFTLAVRGFNAASSSPPQSAEMRGGGGRGTATLGTAARQNGPVKGFESPPLRQLPLIND